MPGQVVDFRNEPLSVEELDPRGVPGRTRDALLRLKAGYKASQNELLELWARLGPVIQQQSLDEVNRRQVLQDQANAELRDRAFNAALVAAGARYPSFAAAMKAAPWLKIPAKEAFDDAWNKMQAGIAQLPQPAQQTYQLAQRWVLNYLNPGLTERAIDYYVVNGVASGLFPFFGSVSALASAFAAVFGPGGPRMDGLVAALEANPDDGSSGLAAAASYASAIAAGRGSVGPAFKVLGFFGKNNVYMGQLGFTGCYVMVTQAGGFVESIFSQAWYSGLYQAIDEISPPNKPWSSSWGAAVPPKFNVVNPDEFQGSKRFFGPGIVYAIWFSDLQADLVEKQPSNLIRG